MPVTNLNLLLLVAIGVFAGIYVGAIPGLSVAMATALLLSLTYTWDTLDALALIVGVYVGGVYGGARAAVLLNIPGAPAAIATTFDGYPMALRGEAGLAIGLATVVSVIGGLIGAFFLTFATPLISKIAVDFSHIDFFLLAMLGLMLVGTLSKGSFLKAVIVAFLGINFGLVGLDGITGAHRFTFGSLELMKGINIIVAILGLFGFAEVLVQLSQSKHFKVIKQVGKLLPSMKQIIRLLPLTMRTSMIGVIVGALPGVGGEIAALLGYDHAKRTTKKPSRPFGEGAYEGVVGPESANNAAVGGALIPMLTLGIPGDAVTAIIIGAFVIHGLNPGPTLMIQSPEYFYVIAGSLFLANIFLLGFGLIGIGIFKRIVMVSKGFILPVITVLTIIGAYTINNNVDDIFWMLGFGVLGYLLRVFNIPVGPLVLGIVLGPLVDKSFRGAMIAANNDVPTLLLEILTQPISLILTIFLIVSILSNTNLYRNTKARIAAALKGGKSG